MPIEIDSHEDADSLRFKARDQRDRMKECFKQRREADKNGGRAKKLSLRGEAYKDNMRRLDEAASMKIFEEHNQRLKFDTVDLHRLFVPEAKLYFDKAVQEVRNHGESSLCVIVGRGKHSKNNIARIKPAIQKHGKRLGLCVEVDRSDVGRLVVSW
ncbi:uncharacterized protein F5147DRAFT_102068 [Suillus discolor]|uniref:Smr domain-containing protein n=1 Tax=Suillus discolor TaxID=1912936 RepID=A0A9P7FB76_9AGAM|nr:uncharacterized protein F5147DRAFT_102068 [Suillus discolor]KAG2111271.1 hypothetical protein F5147DRAFT_102068 [Suillus discolor]